MSLRKVVGLTSQPKHLQTLTSILAMKEGEFWKNN